MTESFERVSKPPTNVLHYQPHHPLDVFFAPLTIALVGASEQPNSIGRAILSNLIRNPFGGTVYPVNPKHASVLGIKAYRNLASVPEPIQLAIIATPALTVPDIITECVNARVPGAIIISAGFKEIGERGAELEKKLLAAARLGNLRLIGPNCLGVMNPIKGLNATFANAIAKPGKVAFISQSGALCTAVLDWSFRENVGFSAFVSIGAMADIGWSDLIYYLGDDPNSSCIVIYMESVGDARAFISAAREVALTKPIIVIKAGRTAAAAHAAASHTGALTGSDDVLDAAFHRCGVLRVNSIGDLFYMAEVLGKQPRPRGPNLAIVTNAGGPGVIATDALITEGGKLAVFAPETMDALDQILPAHWSRGNPIDILGDGNAEKYMRAVNLALADKSTDGLLAVLAPLGIADPTETAERLAQIVDKTRKPILASWMGGSEVEKGEEILNRANIPTFGYPDTAARMFNYMWRYSDNLRGLYETPSGSESDAKASESRERASGLIERVRQSGRTLMTEVESKELLSAYGIPTVETRIAENAEAAVNIAEDFRYPVVLKIYSETITHKTDVGGVQLNLGNPDAVRRAYREIEDNLKAQHSPKPDPILRPLISDHTPAKENKDTALGRNSLPDLTTDGSEGANARNELQQPLRVSVQPMIKSDGYELILGSNTDPQFGPVLLFGMGGQLVEVLQDRALALPPLNTTLARRFMEQTRIFAALQGVRGRAAVNLAALEQLLVRFSQLVTEQRWIKEVDINPLLVIPPSPMRKAGEGEVIALDARVILYDHATPLEQLPRLAIRPYPARYVAPFTMKDGTQVLIRPIRPEDEPLIVKFHEGLSDESVYTRYFQYLRLSDRIAHERLTRICFIDYDREMALVAEYRDPVSGEVSILGVGRLSRAHGKNEAELAALVTDKYQGRGLGKELWLRLIQIAREEKIARLIADILPENLDMQRVAKHLGFKTRHDTLEQLVKAEMELA